MGRKLHKSKRGSTVSFHDVSYEVDVRKLPCSCPNRVTVLSHLSGILTPGMNAIMGPTGCGKSSFLDVLAGRKDPKNVSGYVLLDGERQPVQVHRQVSGYVVQDNIAVNTLTVRENIAFSAALRLSRHVTPKERKAKVAGVIEELGLSAVADRLLGTEYVRGVSGGERKRTCIGIELIKDPLVLYLDEPTTGLDAYTAGSVMKTLRRMALAGRTIVFSIHQPKYSIYRLFDRITLIANGQMIYHGPAGRDPIEYFGRFARHVRSRSPSPSGACSSNQVHSYHWSPSTPRSGDHLLLGECRVQSAPVCRLLPNRLNIHGIPVRTTKQLGLCGLDTSLRPLTMRTASYSDAEALSSHDRSLLGNQSSGFQPHPCSSERLLGEPIELSSRVEESGGQLISDNSSKPDFRSDHERLHFFPFYQACSDLPPPRLCLSRQSGPSQSIVIRSLLNQPNPAYTRIESGSQSPPCEGRHSMTSSVSIYDPIENITNVASHLSDSGAGSRGSVMAPASFRAVRHPVARSWSQSQSPRMCLTPSRTRIRQKRPGRAILCADSPYAASYCQQLFALIGRQCLSMLRDYKSLMSHFIIQFIIALFLGIIYYDLDQSLESGIQNRTGLFFFTCVQLLFINSSMIDAFLRDRVIFKHETSAGFYRVSAYFFSKIIAEVLPTKALPAMLFLPITYLMAGLRSSLRAFLFWELTLTLLTITASGISFSVSAMVTDFRVGSMLLSMFFVLMMITSGFLINVLSLSFWLSWVRYLSILRFAINTLIINEISGMLFCPLNTDLYPNSNGSSGLSTGITNVTSRYEFPLRQSHVSAHAFATSELALSGNCITGEQYMETQAIEFDSEWTVWLNECGIFVIFILALINAYVYLRLMKKYK
ncbi:ATP-binding cassette sub-family G member 2 [Fasciola hepatica]|uniref:ATP-binding cassette sub-family G member 2 n=1 Tax=Fasciola hepatica TaxID=6192 RepID=A0A4E0RH87_FASHE|nr:ATP-binding cassette sub-family G member 2 [Fasciola hepatica]